MAMTVTVREDEMDDRQGLADRVIEAALRHAAFDGWTRATLALAAEEAGLTPIMAEELFPRGTPDALDHLADWVDRTAFARLAHVTRTSLKVRERITLCVRARLEVLTPHREAKRRALTWLALPGNGALAARLLWRTSDRIWRWAGDTALDWNHYSKRALLSGVIATTTLAWLGDRSEDGQETWDFLDRRIAEVLRVGRAVGQAVALGTRVGALADPAPWLRRLRRLGA